MNFDGFDPGIYECAIEINNNGKIQTHNIQAPRIIIESQFLQLINEAFNINVPISIKLSRNVPSYVKHENRWIEVENSVTVVNPAYYAQHNNI